MRERSRSVWAAIVVFGMLLASAAAGAGTVAADDDDEDEGEDDEQEFTWLAGSGFLCGLDPSACPDISIAANEDTIELQGRGTFETDGDVDGGGTFVHRGAEGNIVARGKWRAEEFVSFDSFGPGTPQGLPPSFFGGILVFEVELRPAGSRVTLDAILEVHCAIGTFPPGTEEGIKLDVPGVLNFRTIISGLTLFILEDEEEDDDEDDD